MIRVVTFGFFVLIVGCASGPPKSVTDICEIFREKSGWYADASEAQARWGISVPTMMAFMHQESRFVSGAKPPRTKIWGIIPGPRASDAYGYSQAKNSTWSWYKRESGNHGAQRDDFDDAIDFIGWYGDKSHRQNGISKSDSFRLYLAYHEGHGGYKRASYQSKPWLLEVARKVLRQSQRFDAQLKLCYTEFEKKRWVWC